MAQTMSMNMAATEELAEHKEEGLGDSNAPVRPAPVPAGPGANEAAAELKSHALMPSAVTTSGSTYTHATVTETTVQHVVELNEEEHETWKEVEAEEKPAEEVAALEAKAEAAVKAALQVATTRATLEVSATKAAAAASEAAASTAAASTAAMAQLARVELLEEEESEVEEDVEQAVDVESAENVEGKGEAEAFFRILPSAEARWAKEVEELASETRKAALPSLSQPHSTSQPAQPAAHPPLILDPLAQLPVQTLAQPPDADVRDEMPTEVGAEVEEALLRDFLSRQMAGGRGEGEEPPARASLEKEVVVFGEEEEIAQEAEAAAEERIDRQEEMEEAAEGTHDPSAVVNDELRLKPASGSSSGTAASMNGRYLTTMLKDAEGITDTMLKDAEGIADVTDMEGIEAIEAIGAEMDAAIAVELQPEVAMLYLRQLVSVSLQRSKLERPHVRGECLQVPLESFLALESDPPWGGANPQLDERVQIVHKLLFDLLNAALRLHADRLHRARALRSGASEALPRGLWQSLPDGEEASSRLVEDARYLVQVIECCPTLSRSLRVTPLCRSALPASLALPSPHSLPSHVPIDSLRVSSNQVVSWLEKAQQAEHMQIEVLLSLLIPADAAELERPWADVATYKEEVIADVADQILVGLISELGELKGWEADNGPQEATMEGTMDATMEDVVVAAEHQACG